MYRSNKPLVPAHDPRELAAELDGALTKDCALPIDPVTLYAPNMAYSDLSGRLFIPDEAHVIPNAVPQSWINGQASLQEAGRCIGAELEVALLCMQKRLGKVQYVLSVAVQKIVRHGADLHDGCRTRLRVWGKGVYIYLGVEFGMKNYFILGAFPMA